MPEEAPALEAPSSLWYRVAGLAALLDIHERTVWQWCASGLLPRPRRVGTRWSRWLKTEVDALLETWGKAPKAPAIRRIA